jgi:asparagine synthase (glutamine-hydrolysing)
MCGIAGIIASNPQFVSKERLRKMTDAIAHRGPDAEGSWINKTGTAGLGHRRLSIIDLSVEASQPMHYPDRYSIIHNGEIYNYIELKEALLKKGYSFKSQSDTEVILAAYDCWKEGCLQKFDGMFAFAIWDETEQTLFAARDRFGEKPFYYCFDGKQLLFASGIKALWAAGIEKDISEKILYNYLALGYVQDPTDASVTTYNKIQKLPAAHFLTYNLYRNEFTTSLYWKLETENTNHAISRADAIDKFRQLLTASVKKRLRSDVPIGASLSGGLDSSSIVATINQLQPPGFTFKTFSAVFPGFDKDESVYIRSVKEAFHLENHQTSPTAESFIKDLEKILYQQEEPVASASICAQYKVFELAKKNNLKVLLDGQGADEILAGYHKYYHWFWQELYRNNKPFLKTEIAAARQLSVTDKWDWKNKLAAWFPEKAARQLQQREIKKLKSNSLFNENFAMENFHPVSIYKPVVTKLNDILYYNTCQSGLEELLRYADRNSMAHGVEVRLPFLSHELVEFVFSLPSHFKISGGWTKWLLRKSMEKKLPAEITWRPGKTGFEPPQKQWMQNAMVQDCIHEAKKKLVKEKILKDLVLHKKIQPQDAHAADNFDWRYLVAANLL